MSLPVVAVVGRPNVGKSTLFNKLIGKRLSIVEDTPGVTRDRIYSKCEWRSREFMVVDTGRNGQTEKRQRKQRIFAGSEISGYNLLQSRYG